MADALANLVGQQNARYGIIKIFNALQEANANKHLLYVSATVLPSVPASVQQVTETHRWSRRFLSGADGDVTEGAVPRTRRRSGQHVKRHVQNLIDLMAATAR